MIEVKHVNKTFEDRQVLFDINATFFDGKVNLIIGQSGSGKTVLMKSVVGLHHPEVGEILFDGRDIVKMDRKQIKELRKEIGMLFQGSALFDSETVMGNVMFPLVMFSDMSAAEQRERAQFCIDRVNLTGSEDKYPSELSGGMQKRAAIARAIALNPRYLFCDEPNSGLDPKTSIVIDQLIHELTEEYNMCTVINSHDMNSIMEIGDNILFLKNGKKEWQGSRFEIFHTGNEALDDFVFASDLFKKVKQAEEKEL